MIPASRISLDIDGEKPVTPLHPPVGKMMAGLKYRIKLKKTEIKFYTDENKK